MGQSNGSGSLTRLTGALAAVVLSAGAAVAECSPDVVSIRGDFGQARFDVSVADTMAARNRGLMFVEDMPTLTGMLFVYDVPGPVSFWMRNTLIPLDMVFVGADGVIHYIHPMAQPLDETPIFGGSHIQYVLEINGGLAERLGIARGDALQHPALGADVAWPCEAD